MKEHLKRTPSDQQQQLPNPTDRPLDPQHAALTHSHSTGCRMHDKQHQAMKLDYDQYSDNDPPLRANAPPPFSHSLFTNHQPEMHNYSRSHSPLPGVVPIPFASERDSSPHRRPVSPVTSKYSSPEHQGSNDTTSYRYQAQPYPSAGSRSPPPSSGYQLYDQPQPRKIHYQDQQLTSHNLLFSQPPEVKPSPFQPVGNCSPPMAQSPRPIYDQRFNNHSPPLSQPHQPQGIPNQFIHDHSPPLSQPHQLQRTPNQSIHDRSPPLSQPHQLQRIPNQSMHDRSPPLSQPHQLQRIPNQSIHDRSPPLSQPHQLQRISNQSMHDRSPPLSQPHQLQCIPNQSIHDCSPPLSQPHQLQRISNQSMHDLSPPLTQSPGPIYDQASRSPLRKEPRLPFYYNLPLDEDVQHQLQQSSYYQNLPEGSLPLEYDSGTMHEKTPLIPPMHVPAAEPVNTYTPYGQNAHYSPPPVPSPMNYRPQGNASMYEYHGKRRYSAEDESSTLPEGQPLDNSLRNLKLEDPPVKKQSYPSKTFPNETSPNLSTEESFSPRQRSGAILNTSSQVSNAVGNVTATPVNIPKPRANEHDSLGTEIEQVAAQVMYEVSGESSRQKTIAEKPYDPNLVCPLCMKNFRVGEIQKFRRHVNDRECQDEEGTKKELQPTKSSCPRSIGVRRKCLLLV